MKRHEYLTDHNVAGFVEWAGQLMHGGQLEHSYIHKGNGREFHCATLYQAFQQYFWPNSVTGPLFCDTVKVFEIYRQRFQNIGIIENAKDQREFVNIATEIVKWGEINLPALNDVWARMRPEDLQRHIGEVMRKLDPSSADTDDLRGFKFMRSGFSKIYAALIPGLPIYDSRVACALACLVRLYCQDKKLPDVPPPLELGIPEGRGNASGRCEKPGIYSASKYAKANVQFAWLMQGLVTDPGHFAQVCEPQRVDALQSALFMLGYQRLQNDAVAKP